MQELKTVGISDGFDDKVEEITLFAPSQSSGAKWGHTKEILICVPSCISPKNLSLVSIRRDQHPDIQEGEFLLSDLLGIEVQNVDGQNVGKILGCEDHLSEALHQNLNAGVNLVIGGKGMKTFSLPLAWVDEPRLHTALETKKLVIDDVETWMNLDSQEKSDEDEE